MPSPPRARYGAQPVTRKPTRAQAVIAFIETYCRVPEGAHVGAPMKLAPFQKKFIRAIYDNKHGTSRAYLSIARKNGKTALIAALVLAHLVGPEARMNAQIISGAMSREQAALVFKLAAKIIRISPALQNIVQIVESRKELHGLTGFNTEYRAISAEGKTAHGLSPVLAILDEVGQVRGPQSEFIDAITTAQGAHEDALLIAISTQASSDADLFSIWLDDAERSKDPHIVSHVYAANPDANVTDRSAWKAANPALGLFRSRRELHQRADEAARMPSAENTFRNLNLNQRVSTLSPFMSRNVWESCAAIPDPLDDSFDELFAGLDLSKRTDLTAFVLIGKKGGIWHIHPYFWTPAKGLKDRARRDRAPYDTWAKEGFLRTTPGATVDYEVVARDIADILDGLEADGIAFDRWKMEELRKEFDQVGVALPFIPHGQGFKDMAPALDTLEAEFLNGRARHGNHPVLTMCAANAVVTKDPSENRKLDKSKSTARIDGMQALAMAFGVAGKYHDSEECYEYDFSFID